MNQKQVGNFLSRLYRDETITLILEKAINGEYPITFIVDGLEQERTLSKSDLSAMRKAHFDKKPAIIEIEPFSYVWKNDRIKIGSVGKKRSVNYHDLRVNDSTLEQIKKQFGHEAAIPVEKPLKTLSFQDPQPISEVSQKDDCEKIFFDAPQSLEKQGENFSAEIAGHEDEEFKINNFEPCITPLTPEEIEKRTQEIMSYSLEKRTKLIEQRGFEIYAELKNQYPDITFNKNYIARLIQKEERPIYQSLGKDVPPVSSYLKHTKVPRSRSR